MTLELESDAFAEGERIPEEYTCDGRDVSPPLSLRGVPPEAESLALVVDDPDAPVRTWDHWVLFGLGPDTRTVPEAVPGEAEVLDGARQGTNDFGDLGYGGPCPPPGEDHRYVFTIYALDAAPGVAAGATKEELLREIEPTVVAEARLTGRYRRA